MYIYIISCILSICFFNYIATLLFFIIIGSSYAILYVSCMCINFIIKIINYILYINNNILNYLLYNKSYFINILINYKIIPRYKNINEFKKKLKGMNNNNCNICYKNINKNNTLWIYPCAHFICTTCYINFKKHNIKKCHMCRNNIEYLKKKNEWELEY